MTTPVVLRGDAILTAKSSVVVPTEELEALSATTGDVLLSCDIPMSDSPREAFSVNAEIRDWMKWSQQRSGQLVTEASQQRTSGMEQQQPSCSDSRGQGKDMETAFRKRSVQMRLPLFDQNGIATTNPFTARPGLHSRSTYLPAAGRVGTTPLLTPPEDHLEMDWNTVDVNQLPHHNQPQPFAIPLIVPLPMTRLASGDSSHQSPAALISSISAPDSSSRIAIPSNTIVDSNQGGNPPGWLDEALEYTVSTIAGSGRPSQNLQMVAQLLPTRMSGSSSGKPVYESIFESIQARAETAIPPYITITHAVPHMIAMDEVPTSPPATPSIGYSSGGYFDLQTVFSHAAVVHPYHSVGNQPTLSTGRSINPIVAPTSVHVSVLERYIPPTSVDEYADFFSVSSRSYLVDRLAELSADGGTLLLLYPTKAGAKTFCTRYLGPILEPLLRQFVFYNNLFTDVALSLSRMEAVDAMLDFDQMKTKIAQLCAELSIRGLPQSGPRSHFSLIHSGTGNSILDGSMWRKAYIHQEQARMRKNLVDYQSMGGRMPGNVGHVEITPGMLVREVTDGIRKSQAAFGGVAVELGVFVIRRTQA